jgi:plasmid replication initiation protein
MKRQLIRQHNAITEARYDMSALGKNIFYILLAQLRGEDLNLKKKIYRISVKSLSEIQGKAIEHIQFKRTAKKLLEQVIYVPLGAGKFTQVNLVSSSEYIRGKGTIEIELSEKIRDFLFHINKNFTEFELHEALLLKSKYAKRMYEMLCQYKDTGIFIINIDELKARLSMVDPQTKKDKYPKYGLLRAKVLDIVQKEINEKTTMYFDYTVVKTGKRFSHLKFKIKGNSKSNVILHTTNHEPTSAPQASIYEKLTNKYKLSPWQAKSIIKGVPLDEINKTVYDIQLEVINNKVRNLGGYTAKVFDKKYNLGLWKTDQRDF